VPKGQPKVGFKKDFSSAADFAAFVQGRSLFQMKRAVKGGRDEVVLIVSTLGEAVKAKVPGCYFLLEDSGMLLRNDVSNLKAHRKNTSDGFGDISNKAIAVDKGLLKAYGSLEVLNDGRGVTFVCAADNAAYVEVDGLFKNSTTVLLNEAKTHFHLRDAGALAGCSGGTAEAPSTREKLEHVLANPSHYYSIPAGIIEQLVGLTAVAAIGSSPSFSKEASLACAELGIHQLSQDGTGFQCTLAVAL
jgi:hypothetical protein